MAHILFSISAMYINNEIECEQRDLVGNGFMNSHYIISTEPAKYADVLFLVTQNIFNMVPSVHQNVIVRAPVTVHRKQFKSYCS